MEHLIDQKNTCKASLKFEKCSKNAIMKLFYLVNPHPQLKWDVWIPVKVWIIGSKLLTELLLSTEENSCRVHAVPI